MLRLIKPMLCAFLFTFISFSFASIQMKSASDFSAVKQIIQHAIKENGGKHVLVAFDNDDTLLTMPQDLGSVAWTHWQEGLYRKYKKTNKPSSALTAKTIQGIYQNEYIMFTLSQMVPTDKHIPETIKKFSKEGASVMVATARAPYNLNSTQSQLRKTGFTNGKHELIFSDTAPKTKYGIASEAGVFYPTVGSTHRPLFYMNGIYYLSGQNKGNMLINFLKRFNVRDKTTLIFIDDQKSNVTNVYNAFKKYGKLKNVVSIHYLKEHQRQQDFLNNTAGQQEKAEKAWKGLSSAIKRNLSKNQLGV